MVIIVETIPPRIETTTTTEAEIVPKTTKTEMDWATITEARAGTETTPMALRGLTTRQTLAIVLATKTLAAAMKQAQEIKTTVLHQARYLRASHRPRRLVVQRALRMLLRLVQVQILEEVARLALALEAHRSTQTAHHQALCPRDSHRHCRLVVRRAL